MSSFNRAAGQSTRDMAEKRYRARLRFVLPLAAIVLVLLLLMCNSSSLQIGGIAVIVIAVVISLLTDYIDSKAKRMIKEEHRAIRGAQGEEQIGSLLESLGDDYFVIHDVESAYGNIDHVVISKLGEVFLIETKAHGGRVSSANGQLLLNGHTPEKDFIGQTLRNTYWLKDKIHSDIGLDVWINSILVFTNAFVERIAPIKEVTVINRRYLTAALQKKVASPSGSALWENRENILASLYGATTTCSRASMLLAGPQKRHVQVGSANLDSALKNE